MAHHDKLITHYGKTELLKLQFLQPAEDHKLFEIVNIKKILTGNLLIYVDLIRPVNLHPLFFF